MIRGRLAFAGPLCALVLAAVSARAEECADRFWAPRSLLVYEDPRQTVVGDFDADGRADLAVTVPYGFGGLHIFLRQPDGAYAQSQYDGSVDLGARLSALATADVDGDGDLDLVVASGLEPKVSVLANDGVGTFTHRQTLATAGDLALGDLDGDGDPDLVTTAIPNEINVFVNTGGTFAFAAAYPVAGDTDSVVLAHLDSDAHLDVAARVTDASVAVLWNTGTGALLPAVRLQDLPPTRGLVNGIDLAAGDVNGDGRVDLLTGQLPGTQVGVFANLGGRAFAPVAGLETGLPTNVIALGDADGDGDLDLAVTGHVYVAPPSATVSLWSNDGQGTFTLADRVSGDEDPNEAAFADLDGDGDADLVVTAAGSNAVRLYANANGRLAGAPDLALGGSSSGGAWASTAVAHADLDGDGRDDLLVTQRTELRVFTGGGAPPVVYPVGAFVEGVAAGDLDGDGDRDVVVVDRTGDDLATLRNDGTGALAAPVRVPACDGPEALTLVDMNGDGDLDAVVACRNAGKVVVLANDGTGVFAVSQPSGRALPAGTGPADLAVADFDADGDLDVAVVQNTGVVIVTHQGAFLTAGWRSTDCSGADSIAAGDVNGDGRVDLAVNCPGSVRARVYLNAGGGTFTAGFAPTVIESAEVELADVDGDGDLDLLVLRAIDDSLVLFDNDGAGGFTQAGAWGAGAQVETFTAGDLDGDGDVDVAVAGDFDSPVLTLLWNPRIGCPANAALTVAGGQVAEGDAGTRTLPFAVTLSTPLPGTVTVDYATSDGTASADDYEPVSGTLTFAPGETQKTVAVTVNGDALSEADETVWLALSNASGAPVETEQASGTIANDDPVVTLTVRLLNVEQGHGYVLASPPPLDPSGALCENAGQPDEMVVECQLLYPPDTVVTLQPGAYPDSKFLGFIGACSGTGPCVVTMPATPGAGPVVEAQYLGPRTLTVRLLNVEQGHGYVLASPPPLDPEDALCDNVTQPGETLVECRLKYPPDTVVTLQPAAYPDSKFLGFVGACSGTGPCTVTMPTTAGAGPVVEAQYLGPRTLTVRLLSVEQGHGYVVASPPPLHPDSASCDNVGQPDEMLVECQLHYPPDTVVTLQSTAYPDSKFLGFVQNCSGTDPCVVTMPATAGGGPIVEAQYLGPRTLTASLSSVGGGHGTLRLSPWDASGADACVLPSGAPSASCAFAYAPDTAVTVTAEPASGSVLSALGGACPATGPCVVTMSQAATVTAAFALADQPPTVALTSPADGAAYVARTTVSLTADASDDLGVVRVEFYAGTTLLGTDASSPYAVAWPGVPAGRHVLTARAVDTNGGQTVSSPVTIDVATVLAASADSFVRDESGGDDNHGTARALETQAGGAGSNGWTYLRFGIGTVPSVRSARLRLFGSLTATTGVAVQAAASSAADVSWSETAITWNDRPVPAPEVLASVPLDGSSTAARWYEWDLTAFLQAEKAAGRTAVTIVLRNDAATTPSATFRSREAASNRPELSIVP